MERYVWELTHALVKQGQKVRIICEQADKSADNAIEIIELGLITPKPRWISMLRFSKHVSQYISGTNVNGWIIHSHERCAEHHVTTFHGPSILSRKKRVLDFLSPRLITWEILEKREISGPNVVAILPNSTMIAEQLASLYPSAAENIRAPAYPGVDPGFTKLKNIGTTNTIGFIGKEWQRKGLKFACDIIKEARKQEPELKFIVSGPSPDEITHLFKDWPKGSYTLIGWVSAEHVLPQINLLIHPAVSEPFGMVIAEANAAHIPVLISDNCGIAELINDENGDILPLTEKQPWQISLLRLLKNDKVKSINLSWDNLAKQHIELYQGILQGKQERHDEH